jgi:hypothetical protein
MAGEAFQKQNPRKGTETWIVPERSGVPKRLSKNKIPARGLKLFNEGKT